MTDILTWYNNGVNALVKSGISPHTASYIMKHAAGEGGYLQYYIGDGNNRFLDPNKFAEHVNLWLFSKYPNSKTAGTFEEYIKGLYTPKYVYNAEYGTKYKINNIPRDKDGNIPQEVLDDLYAGYLNHFSNYKSVDKSSENWFKTIPNVSLKVVQKPDALRVNIKDMPLHEEIPVNKNGNKLDNSIIIYLGDKEFEVEEAKTELEKRKGLSNINSLPKNKGMIFYFDSPQRVSFWMKDTLIPLDIIYIDKDNKVISVNLGVPLDEHLITCNNVKYVVELNVNSGVEIDDELEFDDEDDSKYVMKVLAPDGSTQMNLEGGERIVSRRETKILIKKAKKAYKSKDDKDYKSLGKYMFKVLTGLDNREPEYVQTPL